MLPYLLSERAPQWSSLARGGYVGLTRDHRREHLVRAAIEGVCLQLSPAFDQPMAEPPGAKFVYNSGATELLSYLIKKGTGKQAHEYAAEQLFAPLGITDTYWKTTPTGLADTEGGLYLAARDLAKLGYLYLHDGVWDGRRLLPEGWVKASTSPLVDTRPGVERSRRYGYQWWVLPYGKDGRYAYAALGYGGQRLIVVPEHDLIAVFTGWNIYESPEFAPYDALDRVLAAVK